MVLDARRDGYAVAQLNTNGGDYHLSRAILEAASECRSPVILGVYETNAAYVGFPYIAASLTRLAEEIAPDIPVALHLDHGSSIDVCREALDAGFTSVMYDGSKRAIEENIAESSQACALAHARGATFEAELGQLLGGGSDPNNPNLVSVEEVVHFAGAVPVDMLAVAIGNSHGFYKERPKLNMHRLREVRGATDVPLVLHGTTGLGDDQVEECVALGITKINVGTALRTDYIEYYLKAIQQLDHQGHPWRIGREVKDRLKDDCARYLRLAGSADRA
jgi:ketose-bisphosphate aldolase